MPYIEQTICFTSSLHKLVYDCGLSQEKLNAIGESVNDLMGKIRLLAKALSPAELAQAVHRAVDVEVAIQRAKPDANTAQIRCGTGCAHCCRQVVACSPPEAALLLEAAERSGIAIDYDRLHRQAGRDERTWQEQPVQDRDCVFLGPDGLCQVYDQRPASCRKYFSITPPELCNIERYPTSPVSVWFALDAELITTALFTAQGCGFLPDLLLQQKEVRRG